MALYAHSSTWRWLVAESKKSPLFFAGFSAAMCGAFATAALGLQALTNPGSVDLGGRPKDGVARDEDAIRRETQLLRGGRPDAALIGRVNKERLGQMLGEIQAHENTEDRYAAALRGETLLGPPNARHLAAGSSMGTHRPMAGSSTGAQQPMAASSTPQEQASSSMGAAGPKGGAQS